MILPIEIKTYMEDEWTPCCQKVSSPVDPRIKYNVSNLWDCPEDACIFRDLVSAQEWVDVLRLGMQLAREGVTGLEVKEDIVDRYDDD